MNNQLNLYNLNVLINPYLSCKLKYNNKLCSCGFRQNVHLSFGLLLEGIYMIQEIDLKYLPFDWSGRD